MAEEKTTIPKEVVEKLTKLSAAVEVDMKTIMIELKQIIDSDPSIQAMTNKIHQINYASALLIRRYSMTDGSKQLYIRPFAKPRSRIITSQGQKKYIGDISGLIQLIQKNPDGTEKIGEVQYGAGTLWEKAAESMIILSPNKVYKTALRVNEAKNGVLLGGNSATFVEANHKMPTKEEYFKENIESSLIDYLTTLDDLKINQKDDPTDIRIVRGTVLDATTGTTAKMGEYGRYSITDDSFIGKDNFPMWVHPDEVEYGISSELYFIGTADVDNSNPQKPIVRFNCHFVMPAGSVIKKEEEPTPIAKESEEVNLDDISEELEEKEESKEEEFAI
jgi:hypothetical protein